MTDVAVSSAAVAALQEIGKQLKEIDSSLGWIAFWLFLLLVFKDMSK